MGKTTRKTGQEGKSSAYYRTHFRKGGPKTCFRCGGQADEFSGEIVQVNGKWLHVEGCLDPEDE